MDKKKRIIFNLVALTGIITTICGHLVVGTLILIIGTLALAYVKCSKQGGNKNDK